jgi:starch synthase
MAASEAHPFAKTGGLAEVVGALPTALSRLGHHVTVVLPKYRAVEAAAATRIPHTFRLGSRGETVAFLVFPAVTAPAAAVQDDAARPGSVTAVLVDVPELFDRDGLYGSRGRDFPDNARRFAVLSRAALEYARLRGERISVIHAHDWQAGLVPVYQKMHYRGDPALGGVPAVFTIHNLAFQGVFPAGVLPDLGLGSEMLHLEAMEYWGQVSFLKGGVNFSEKITTVSPTYAREILTPQYGFGMDGVLRRRQEDLLGILNGIDVTRWNPEADELVPARFSAVDLSGKRAARRALLDEVGLAETPDGRPVIGMISRLTDQKGFDLIAAAAGDLMALNATWVFLASGEPLYENLLRAMAARHPDRVSTAIGFSERLAHLIEAGADIFLMPSRFEPCGLNQIYSLRYGTVPVVRATGGLQDTVVDAADPRGNGFKFSDYSPGALVAAVKRALAGFADKAAWERLQRAGMARDSSWDVSAREYVKVYRGLGSHNSQLQTPNSQMAGA